jgi:hypothetical protein
MANDSDIDPDDLTSSSSASRRNRGIPQGADDRKSIVGDLSAEKQGLPSFSKQKVKGKPGASDELDVGGTDLQRDAQPAPTPVLRNQSLAKRSTEDAAKDGREGSSGNEQDAELGRESGRPRSVRASDFEPQVWESSTTRVDRGDFKDSEEGPDTRRFLTSCVRVVSNGLGNFWSRLNIFELASVVAFMVVALIGLFFFRNLVHSVPAPEQEVDASLSAVVFPAKGSLLTLSSVDAAWRNVADGDPVRPNQEVIPEVNVTLGEGNGYLRILFRDEAGKIRGDTFTEKVTNGQVNGSGLYEAICSEGYTNLMNLVEVQAGRLEPWTVELFETSQYDVPLEEWNLLAGFDMPSKPREGKKPS